MEEKARKLCEEGQTVVHVARGGKVIGILGLAMESASITLVQGDLRGIACAAMSLSSVSVIGNALRPRRVEL